MAKKSKAKVIKLKNPLVGNNGGIILDEITLREPKAGDLWEFKFKQDAEYSLGEIMEIASGMSGQSVSLLKQLALSDCMSIVNEVSSFLSDGMGDGKEQPPK